MAVVFPDLTHENALVKANLPKVRERRDELSSNLSMTIVSSVTGGGQGATHRPSPKISSEKFALSRITEIVISYFNS